jgi:hypothetical protein
MAAHSSRKHAESGTTRFSWNRALGAAYFMPVEPPLPALLAPPALVPALLASVPMVPLLGLPVEPTLPGR